MPHPSAPHPGWPRSGSPCRAARWPWLDFSSGYVQRTIDRFPKQGAKLPWKLNQNYVADVKLLRHGRLDEDMVFKGKAAAAKRTAQAAK